MGTIHGAETTTLSSMAIEIEQPSPTQQAILIHNGTHRSNSMIAIQHWMLRCVVCSVPLHHKRLGRRSDYSIHPF
jgi:hypothetical protein